MDLSIDSANLKPNIATIAAVFITYSFLLYSFESIVTATRPALALTFIGFISFAALYLAGLVIREKFGPTFQGDLPQEGSALIIFLLGFYFVIDGFIAGTATGLIGFLEGVDIPTLTPTLFLLTAFLTHSAGCIAGFISGAREENTFT